MLNNTQTRVNINVKFGSLKHVMNWCKENCSGDWTITNYTPDLFSGDYNLNDDVYEFTFENEHDVLAFTLKWT